MADTDPVGPPAQCEDNTTGAPEGSSVGSATAAASKQLESPSLTSALEALALHASSDEQSVGSSLHCAEAGETHGDREVLKSWLKEVFAKHKPESVADIDELMAKHTNNEQAMIEQIINDHGRDGVRAPTGWEPKPSKSQTKTESDFHDLVDAATAEKEAPSHGKTDHLKINKAAAAAGASAEVKGKPAEGAGGKKGTGDGSPGKGNGEGAELVKVAASAAEFSALEQFDWMPTLRKSRPSKECIRRVRNDVGSLMRDPIPGLFACPDEDLVTVVHALVTGPFDTPYEGGFFYFVMHCPDDYPHNPPRVRLMTTGGGTVRFNPNFYSNGKVCLSILGTWNGPRWTPVQSISSVLLSIQSLMTEKPYHNEPGFEKASNPRDVLDYSNCITHETLRVAVCSMVQSSSLSRSMPECFRDLTRDLFLAFVPRYEIVCEQNMYRDREKMVDPFGHNRGVFRYGAILRMIKSLARSVEELASPAVNSKEGECESGSSERKAAGSTEAAAVVREADVTGESREPSPGAEATSGACDGRGGEATIDGGGKAGSASSLRR